MRTNTLRGKIIARAIAQVDRLSPEDLLAFIDRPLMSSERRDGSATQIVLAHAMRRLDVITR